MIGGVVRRYFIAFSASVISLPGPAIAQTAATGATAASSPPPNVAPTSAQDSKAVDAVVVTAAGPGDQMTLEKRSYSLAKDLSAATGSVADALRNVPSVDVDAQGTLSLRGDPNVTVLVNGKPSTRFSGPDRAAALQQMPADQVERVEVLTSPSADLNPEGSAGIINLVMKKAKGAGPTGGGYVTVGTAGGKRAGGNFGYNSESLSITSYGSLNYIHAKSHTRDDFSRRDPDTNEFVETQRIFIPSSLNRSATGHIGIDYTVEPKSHLTSEITVDDYNSHSHPFTRFVDYGSDGGVESILEQYGTRRVTRRDLSAAAGLQHSFATDEDNLSIQLTYNRNAMRDNPDYIDVGIIPPSINYEQPKQFNTVRQSGAKATYRTTVSGKLKIVAGYEFQQNNNDYNQFVLNGSNQLNLSLDDKITSEFRFEQTIHALYGTLARTVHGVDVQAGLRVENVDLHFRERAIGYDGDAGYTKAYPNLLVGYKLNSDEQLRFNYSRRVQRPNPVLFDPFPLQIDPRNYQAGNPELHPQITDSLELSYQKIRNNRSFVASLYSRFNNDVPTAVQKSVGDIRIYQIDNIGKSTESGLELTVNTPLPHNLTFNANGRLYRTELDSANLGFENRSAWAAAGKANVDWQASPQDLVQLNLSVIGKSISSDGTLHPTASLNLGWRRKFKNGVIATVSAQDVFATQRYLFTTDRYDLQDRNYSKQLRQSVWLRLDFPFGGGKAKEPTFDFDGS